MKYAHTLAIVLGFLSIGQASATPPHKDALPLKDMPFTGAHLAPKPQRTLRTLLNTVATAVILLPAAFAAKSLPSRMVFATGHTVNRVYPSGL